MVLCSSFDGVPLKFKKKNAGPPVHQQGLNELSLDQSVLRWTIPLRHGKSIKIRTSWRTDRVRQRLLIIRWAKSSCRWMLGSKFASYARLEFRAFGHASLYSNEILGQLRKCLHSVSIPWASASDRQKTSRPTYNDDICLPISQHRAKGKHRILDGSHWSLG
jgi:hypothetical protein